MNKEEIIKLILIIGDMVFKAIIFVIMLYVIVDIGLDEKLNVFTRIMIILTGFIFVMKDILIETQSK